MKKNTKGFTLIELLAVIVILAIIALIAVPVILNILTKARQSAAEDTAYSVLNAAELYYAEYLLDNPTAAFTAKTFTFVEAGTIPTGLELKGTVPTGGSVTVDSKGTAHIGTSTDGENYTGSLTINKLTCTQSGNTVNCQ